MSLQKFRYIVVFLLFFNVAQVFTSKVYLLFPKGISIKLDYRPGIVNALFDVNITRCDRNLSDAHYNKNLHYSFANAWTFMEKDAELAIGDIIGYRVIINKDKTNQQQESAACKVTELPKLGRLKKHGWTFNYDILLTCDSSLITEDIIEQAPLPAPVPTPDEDIALKLRQCQEGIFNSSLSLMSLQIEVEQLRKLTQKLSDFEEMYPLAKQMTLAGRIPPDGDPAETVSFILYEKLDLKPKIVSAFRDSTYSIRFTVSTVLEKIEILEVAKYILPSTRITVT